MTIILQGFVSGLFLTQGYASRVAPDLSFDPDLASGIAATAAAEAGIDPDLAIAVAGIPQEFAPDLASGIAGAGFAPDLATILIP